MELANTAYIVQNAIEQLFNHLQIAIGQVQAVNSVPVYLHSQLYTGIKNGVNAMVPQYQIEPGSIVQQKLQHIPKLKYDNLMPKEVAKQTIQRQSPSFMKTNSIFSPKSRFGFAKRRSSMMNSTIKSKNDSLRNSLASIHETKKKNNPLIQLPTQQPQNDPEMISERTKKQAVENENRRYELFLKKRQQQNNEKRQMIQSQFANKDYTFDYAGEIYGAEIQQGAIKHLGAKMKLGAITKRQREDALLSNEVSKSISFNKRNKQFNTLDISATHEIPMFPQTTRTDKFLGLSSEFKQCKFNDYKKHYGGKYHRLENLHTTLQIKRNEQQQFDLENSRKQIKDNESIKKSLVIYKPHIPNQRKLALPKLRGVYKVLDRYEDD